jgi:hypothetical protein
MQGPITHPIALVLNQTTTRQDAVRALSDSAYNMKFRTANSITEPSVGGSSLPPDAGAASGPVLDGITTPSRIGFRRGARAQAWPGFSTK